MSKYNSILLLMSDVNVREALEPPVATGDS